MLTLAVEFLAGHFLFRNTWERLLADYNLAQGRVWILVLVTTLVTPVLVHAARAGRPCLRARPPNKRLKRKALASPSRAESTRPLGSWL